MKLTIELVPSTSWFSNVRSQVKPSDWDKLRKISYVNAGYKCQICGGIGENHPVECHEIWDYDDENHIQKLSGMIALCPACHEVKHIGLAHINGRFVKAFTHLRSVNKLSLAHTKFLVQEAFDVYEKRSKFEWSLDLTLLDDMGIPYRKKDASW